MFSSAILLLGDLGIKTVLIGFLAIFGALTLFLFAYVYFSEKVFPKWFGRKLGFSANPWTPILDYRNEEVLRSIASHHKIEGPPIKLERKRGKGVHGGPRALGGSAESDTTETHEPLDDLAELTWLLLEYLKKRGALNQSVDCVRADQLNEPLPFLRRERDAREFFKAWLAEHFPDGLGDIAEDEMARALAKIGRQVPATKLRELVTRGFEEQNRRSDRLLFLEGEWSICEKEGTILLTRTDLRIKMHNGDIGAHSLPMPSGISITADLNKTDLTSHGRTRMQGVNQPIRASILATKRAYRETDKCFDLIPIAVFQHLDEEED